MRRDADGGDRARAALAWVACALFGRRRRAQKVRLVVSPIVTGPSVWADAIVLDAETAALDDLALRVALVVLVARTFDPGRAEAVLVAEALCAAQERGLPLLASALRAYLAVATALAQTAESLTAQP